MYRSLRRASFAPSEITEHLHLECRDCADDSSREWKRARHDAAGFDRRLERASANFRAQRLEESVAGLRYAAREHNDIRIEDVEEVGDTRSEKTCRLAHDFARHGIALLRRFVYGLRR